MDYLRPEIILPFFAAFAILAIRKYNKSLWDTIQLPLLIVIGVLSIVLVFIMLFAAYTMIQNRFFSMVEKVLYCFVLAGLIGLFAWLNISNWKKWKSRHKH